MWYHWGLGIGHSYSHDQDNLGHQCSGSTPLCNHVEADDIQADGVELYKSELEDQEIGFKNGKSQLEDQEMDFEDRESDAEDQEMDLEKGRESESESDSNSFTDESDSQKYTSDRDDEENFELFDTYQSD